MSLLGRRRSAFDYTHFSPACAVIKKPHKKDATDAEGRARTKNVKNENAMIDGVIRLMLKIEEVVEFRCREQCAR